MGFLTGTLILLFILNCLFLILLVLLQTGKNSSLGLMGGASQSVFGSSTVDILTKITRGSAAAFLILALIISFIFAKKVDTVPNLLEDESSIQSPKEEKKPEGETPIPSK